MVIVDDDFELKDFSTQTINDVSNPTVVPADSAEDTVVYWAWFSASLYVVGPPAPSPLNTNRRRLFITSLCLILFPRLFLFFAETSSETRNALSPLEKFLALHFGIWLATISVTLVLNVQSLLSSFPLMSDILIFVGSVLPNRAPKEAAKRICKPSLAGATDRCQRLVSLAFVQHERHGTLVIHRLHWVRCHELVGPVGGELLLMIVSRNSLTSPDRLCRAPFAVKDDRCGQANIRVFIWEQECGFSAKEGIEEAK
jgi:hypothetical protein